MVDDGQGGWQHSAILHLDTLPKETRYLWLAILSLHVMTCKSFSEVPSMLRYVPSF